MGLSFRRRRRGNVGGVETVPILVPTATAAIAAGAGEEDPKNIPIPSAGLPVWVLTAPYIHSNKDDVSSSDGTPDTITMMTSTGGVRGGTTTSNTLPQSPLVKNNATVPSEDVNNMASSSSSPVAALFPGTGGTGELPRLRKARGGNNSSSATTNTQTKNVVGKNVSVKNDNNSNKDTMRRINSIKKGFYLTPPKKDTPNIHPTTHPRKVESSPTSVKSVNNGSSNYWNGNDVDVSSTFELMYKQHIKHQAAVNGGRGEDCSSSGSSSPSPSGDCHANEQQSLLLLAKSSSPYKQHGLSGACTLSTVATSVTNYQPSTVVTTSSSTITTNIITYQQQQQCSPPRLHHQNLSSLFERSMEEDYDDDDDDYDNANDTLPKPPSGHVNSRDDDDDVGGNDANNNGTDAVVPLSDYSSLSSKTSLKEQQQQHETNNTGGVLSLLKRRSSIVDGAAAGANIKNRVLVGVTHPSPPPPKNVIIAKTNPSSSPVVLDMPSSVPKFINRSASDDLSKASTLTEPDYFHSTTNRQVPTTKPLRGTTTTTNTITNTRSTPPKIVTSTDDADGITTSIVTSVIDDGQHGITLAMFAGAGTMMGADRLWDSVQHAFNALDAICLPACRNISNGEKDMTNRCKSMQHLEEEDKFTPAFQNEIIKTGISLIYHESSSSATTDSTDWVKSSVTLFLHPGNSTHLRQPILVWATLSIVSQMKMAMCAFDDSGSTIEDDWNMISLMDVHSILGDEGDHEGGCVRAASSAAGAASSSFFSITSSNGGSVYVFEAPSSEARDYIVRGLRLVIARLTYDIIMGDSKITSDLLNSSDEDAAAAAAVEAKKELG